MKPITVSQVREYRKLQAKKLGNIFVEVVAGKHASARGLFDVHSNENASNPVKAYVDVVTAKGAVHPHPDDCLFYWM